MKTKLVRRPPWSSCRSLQGWITQFFTKLLSIAEPTDAGVVPPEYRTSFPSANNPHHVIQQQQQQQPPQQHQMQPQQQHVQNGSSPPRPTEKKPHQFTNTPVEEWAKEQVSVHTSTVYKVGQVVVHLSMVVLDLYIPSSCPARQPILPSFQMPKQN